MDAKVKNIISDVMHWVIIILSALLITYISVDTFKGINFLKNRNYMTFQLWVCIIFMADFFIELVMAPRKWHYVKTHVGFLLLAIPYLNIINMLDLDVTPGDLFFLRFIPLARGVLAMAIVVGYISTNRISSLLASYIVIMLSIVYFASLIFLYREQPVNPMVTNYGDALWWAFTTATSVGCAINPMTVTGKVLAVVVSGIGITMFPLFTVYLTSMISRYRKRMKISFSTPTDAQDVSSTPQKK